MDGALLLLTAAAVTGLDHLTKQVVRTRLAGGRLHGWRGSVGLRPVVNRGWAALTLTGRGAVVIWAALVAGMLALLTVAPAVPALAVVGLGISLGGATGNLIDRLTHGAVLDFVVVGPWPTFNLADAAMVAGVGLVAVALL